MDNYFCKEHNCKYFKNQKGDRTWYSHKIHGGDRDGEYCNLRDEDKAESKEPEFTRIKYPFEPKEVNTMYACNAMNNAINLAVAGKIQLSDIEERCQELYNILGRVK